MNAYKDVADQGIEPRSDTRKVSVLTNRRNGQNGRKRPKKEIILTKTKNYIVPSAGFKPTFQERKSCVLNH